jgi:hypothetical protein
MGYGKLALREWTRSQQFYRDPENSFCWVAKRSQFRRRHCRDARMLDNLRLEAYGTMDAPQNDNSAPGAITAAVAVGMFYHPKRISPEQVGPLAGSLIALTHGNPETFLSGVVLAYAITGILQEPEQPLDQQFLQAIAVMDGQFRDRFPQAAGLAVRLRKAIRLAQSGTVSAQEGMEQLQFYGEVGNLILKNVVSVKDDGVARSGNVMKVYPTGHIKTAIVSDVFSVGATKVIDGEERIDQLIAKDIIAQ